ncbi:RidA family protein [Ileibacterium valens]|uniref:Regulator n=1 Tax=Ileibacterium valens TaxID=1862668 RepID=A0A1U7ND28_9FIRM|nr:RidA family protein [Ileibacterium valens]OLU36761.1 regulator [Ileibacterium valens]OLU38980.1 regulator [Erysipelotrichaceae bacterium NYU-BL-F16]OLU41255.1 regulator [Erysipelotrichaceae bacterium NYU-BL-E8]
MNKVHTDLAPAAVGPYSQAVKVNGMVYLSGQIPIDPTTGQIVEGAIREQTLQVMKNLSAVLSASNSDMDHVVKTTCFLADINDFTAFNEVYAEYFVNKPARSCVAVKDIPKGVFVEVECIAVCKD